MTGTDGVRIMRTESYPSSTQSGKWPSATRERPCPICSKANRCRIAPDGLAGICWRSGSKEVWRDGSHNGNSTNHRPDPKPKSPKKTYISADKALEAAARHPDLAGAKLVKTWTYPGDVMRVARFDLPNGDKEFRPVHRLENGAWAIGDAPKPLPLYRRDEIPPDEPIVVLEGEACADLAAELGLAAVTSAHGSSSSDESDWTPLAGRDVWIFPDNDPPGEEYARSVARILIGLGCKVKIIHLPDLPPGGDIVQFDAAIGGTPQDTRAEIERLAEAAPLVTIGVNDNGDHDDGRGLIIARADSIERTEVEWAWPGWLPFGKIIVFFGFPDAGKGTLAMKIVAILSVGGRWPDGTQAPKCSSLILSKEDDISDTIAPRLDAAEADPKQVYFLTGVNERGENGDMVQRWFTLDMIGHVRDMLKKHPDIRLLVIDPPGSHVPESLNENSQAHVRSLLGPWAELAQEFKVMVLFIMHRPKAGGTKAIHGAIGSMAWIAAARVGCMISRDKNDPNLRLILRVKNNLAPPMPNLSFRITGPVAHVEWAGEVETTADDVAFADADGRPGPEPKKLEAARDWLAAELAGFDACPVEKLKADAKSAGLNWRTIQRASGKMGVKVERSQFGGGYTWRIPKP